LHPQGEEGPSGEDRVAEFGDFVALGRFTPAAATTWGSAFHPWVTFLIEELSRWESDIRVMLPPFTPRLRELSEALNQMHTQLDEFFVRPGSLLQTCGITVPEATAAEFTKMETKTFSLLSRFLLYANAWDKAYSAGDLIDVKREGLDPDDMRVDLLTCLKGIRKSLTSLAGYLEEAQPTPQEETPPRSA
jgi:hypothetical protein